MLGKDSKVHTEHASSFSASRESHDTVKKWGESFDNLITQKGQYMLLSPGIMLC